jgi:hypothetical protein
MATSMDLDQKNFPDDLKGAEGYVQPSLRAGVMKPQVDELPSHIFASEENEKSGMGEVDDGAFGTANSKIF